ncbi:MAG TPA: tyrosine-type recombinase/integrase [Mycobacterium sp.]|jgi:site-specific recombinase XerD
MDTLITDWRLSQARKSPRTLIERERVVRLLARRRRVDPVTATWRDVAAFLADPAFRDSTAVTYYAALRSWFAFLVEIGAREDDPLVRMTAPTAKRGTPHPVTTTELGAVLRKVNRRRTRAMVLLAAYEGLRVSEIARVRGEHFRGGQLYVRGKGGHELPLPVHPVITDLAATFPRVGLWFPSYTDQAEPITSNNVSRVVSEVMHRAGVNSSAHSLRHWYGTQVLTAAGGNLRTAQRALRHSSPATTAIYTLITDEQLREAIDGLPVPLHAVPVA